MLFITCNYMKTGTHITYKLNELNEWVTKGTCNECTTSH
jgi:hypothetical protein